MNYLNRDYNDNYNDWLVMDDEVVDIAANNAPVSKPQKSERYDKPQKNKSKKKTAVIIACVAAVIIVAGGITGICLWNNDTIQEELLNKEFTFDDGVTVSGVSIAGKTMEEAKALLTSNESSFIKPVKITVNANGENYQLTEADFQYTYNIDEVLNQIKSDLENDNRTAASDYSQGATQSLSYDVTATVVEDSIQENVKKIEEKTNKDPENATVTKFHPFAGERFEYKEASVGYKLDTDDLLSKINNTFAQNLSEDTITADVQEVKAEISVDDIKKNVVQLSRYETVSYNNANGTSNMKVSLEACNGSIINPGETWSFNKCTGDSNLESNGYKPAQVISEGALVDGVGGGICQSSSTIYNAAIRANMTVEERYNHKWASSYVPTGLDATIDYPRLDLKLSNPTDYQMFMECKLDGKTLIVSIWGYKSDTYDSITCENEIVKKGDSSYTVKAWRVYIKDGKEVKKESLGSSTYDSKNGYIFKNAENDSNVKAVSNSNNDEKKNETSQVSQSSSSSRVQSSSRASSSSKPASSSSKPASSSSSKPTSSSSKPTSSSSQTEKPTQAPTSSTSGTSSKPQESSSTESESVNVTEE